MALARASLLLLLTRAAALSKRGLANGVSAITAPAFCSDLNLFPAGRLSWTYSWQEQPANTSCAAIHAGGPISFEPMRWGQNSGPMYNASATHLLGFNEPNSAAQSNLSPAAAAALWPTVAAQAKAAGLRLISPAPSGQDTAWLHSFFLLCNGCKAEIDAIAVHPYVCDEAGLKGFIADWYSTFNKPLWITEFNCGNGSRKAPAADHLAWMNIALPLLDADARVERYAWMSARDVKVPGAALISPEGVLTPLGQRYARV